MYCFGGEGGWVRVERIENRIEAEMDHPREVGLGRT